MKPLSPEQQEALGIAPDSEIRLAGRDTLSDDRVAHGFSGSSPGALAPDEAIARFRSVTVIEPFHEAAAKLGAPEAKVTRADGTPGLFMLAFEGLDVKALAHLETVHDDEACIIDSRAKAVTLVARGPSGECLLRFEDDMFEWYDIARSASPAMRAIAAWTPDAAPTLTPPTSDSLLGGFDAPAWMTAPFRPEFPRNAYAVCAAVGTLGRLWAPRGTSTPASEAMARLKTDDDPMARARRWFDALPSDVHDAVAELACVEADALAAALDALDAHAVDDREQARDEALAWLERRDDLASVAILLRAKPGAPLSIALSALDRDARVHATTWRMLSPIRSPRLDAVAWQEPDAWWVGPARVS